MNKLLILAASLLLLALPAHAGGKYDKGDGYSKPDRYEKPEKPDRPDKPEPPSKPDPGPSPEPARSEPSRNDNGQTSRCGLFVNDPHCPQGARSQRILKGLWPF